MEFRASKSVEELKAKSLKYLTHGLQDVATGEAEFDKLTTQLGNCVESYPWWHPIITCAADAKNDEPMSMSDIELYKQADYTRYFVRGFVTCPYGEDKANELMRSVNSLEGLNAYRLDKSLYADNTYPVVVEAYNVTLDADGTLKNKDAIGWFMQTAVKNAHSAKVAETWWNMQGLILGHPHGSRSSLFVNQYTGGHMKKLLEAMNNSGMFGPVKEWSLDMLPEKKRKKISEILLRAAIDDWNGKDQEFTFTLRDELCKARINDTFNDGTELSIEVTIGKRGLVAKSFYDPKRNLLDPSDPNGKQALAKKFI
jgi:hypothetical protein